MTFCLAALREKLWCGRYKSDTGAKVGIRKAVAAEVEGVRVWTGGKPKLQITALPTLDGEVVVRGTTEVTYRHREKEMEVSGQIHDQKVRTRELYRWEAGVGKPVSGAEGFSPSWRQGLVELCTVARESSLLVIVTHEVKWNQESDRGWRHGGSAVRNMYCSFRGPQVNSQFPCHVAELPVTTATGDAIPLDSMSTHKITYAHEHTHIHTHADCSDVSGANLKFGAQSGIL